MRENGEHTQKGTCEQLNTLLNHPESPLSTAAG